MAILGPKPWINPFGKMSFFRILELLVFITQKGVFSIQIIEKVIFLTYTAEKKMSQKWPYLDQNHGLTFLEKCQFFDFLNLRFLQPRKAFFVSIISEKSFSRPIFNIKKFEKRPVLDQNDGLTPLVNLQFFDILYFFHFLQRRKAFFRSRIS